MDKFFRYFMYGFIFLGDNFVKYKIGPVNLSDLFVLINLFYIFIKKDEFAVLEIPFFNKLYLFYFFIFILSLLGFYRMFNLDIEFDSGYYLIRQAYLLIYFPAIFLGLAISHKEKKIIDIFRNELNYIFVMSLWAFFFNRGLVTMSFHIFLIIILSYVPFFEGNTKKIFWFIFSVYITVFFFETDASSYKLTFLILSLLFFLNYSKFLKKIVRINYFFIAILFIVGINIIIFYQTNLSSLDHNVVFRTLIWSSQIELLENTFFWGVGFGTSYMDFSLFQLASNVENGRFDAHFRIPSHNSFLTFLFRTGIPGLLILFKLLFEFIKPHIERRENKVSEMAIIIFIFINFNALFHPFLEVPRSFLAYIFALFVIWKLSEEEKEDIKWQN
jgi:hypothetical protein